jgi:hypothetical protein
MGGASIFFLATFVRRTTGAAATLNPGAAAAFWGAGSFGSSILAVGLVLIGLAGVSTMVAGGDLRGGRAVRGFTGGCAAAGLVLTAAAFRVAAADTDFFFILMAAIPRLADLMPDVYSRRTAQAGQRNFDYLS